MDFSVFSFLYSLLIFLQQDRLGLCVKSAVKLTTVSLLGKLLSKFRGFWEL